MFLDEGSLSGLGLSVMSVARFGRKSKNMLQVKLLTVQGSGSMPSPSVRRGSRSSFVLARGGDVSDMLMITSPC